MQVGNLHSDEEIAAYEAFKRLRWPETNGEPVCPNCGHRECYAYKARRIFKCKVCQKQFSVTSGTSLSSRKLSFADLMKTIDAIRKSADETSKLQLARDLGLQYRTVWGLVYRVQGGI